MHFSTREGSRSKIFPIRARLSVTFICTLLHAYPNRGAYAQSTSETEETPCGTTLRDEQIAWEIDNEQ